MGNALEFRNRMLFAQTPDMMRMISCNIRLAPKELQQIFPAFSQYRPLPTEQNIYIKDSRERPKQRQIIFQIMGGSAAGKDTILKDLKQNLTEHGIKHTTIKTTTTRDRRVDKGEPVEAHNWPKLHEFKTMKKAGAFIETVHQGKHWYGTEYAEFDKAISQKDTPIIFCTADIYGFSHIKEYAQQKGIEIIGIYLLPDMPIRDYAKRILKERRLDFFWRFPKAIAEIKRALGQIDAFVLNTPAQDKEFTDITNSVMRYLGSRVVI